MRVLQRRMVPVTDGTVAGTGVTEAATDIS
jgi:hypothetical protein